ncbi:MAG: phosphoglycerate kinase [Nitrospirae bacterium 13_2_20CM_2_61_4]|nr:MAG: phosphoglycerate kinase [Nitrospirae bacterium 13_2_20CM_2_61_4]
MDPRLSLAPVARRLQRLLGKEVLFAEDCIGAQAEMLVHKMKPGDVLLLENLRFHLGEEQNDDQFAKALASLADVYVNDAFGAAHRNHASVSGITKYLPMAGAGFLMRMEIEYLVKHGRSLKNQVYPVPAAIDKEIARLKLAAMGVGIDRLTKEQEKYLASWDMGT